MARPKYKPSEAQLKAVYEGAKRGLNHAELAKSINISLSSFKRNSGLFRPLIKKGREEGDPGIIKQVKSALIKRALGYDVDEQHVKRYYPAGVKVGDTKGLVTETKAIKKSVPGSVAAAIFYLCNMDKENWQNVSQIDHNIKSVGDIKLALTTVPDKLLKDLCKHLGMNYDEIVDE